VCVADPSFSRHLSQIGLFGNRNLKRRPFVDSILYVVLPPTVAGYYLASAAPSFSWLRDLVGVLSPLKETQYFLWFLLALVLITVLASPIAVPQAVSASSFRTQWIQII
jgi:hypothetical protein